MIFSKELTEKQIEELFTDNEKCLEFLADLKWIDGFICRKCENKNYCPGKTPYSRRCTKCKKEESATSGTIFHHCRFDICKAFYIAHSVCKGNEELSSYEFARRLALRQMTCWKFKDKLKKAIESSGELSENWIEILT
jgi:hypothetical protein